MKGYKGFEKGLICRGKQYAENTVFEEESAKICESGIHFCVLPHSVFRYYSPGENHEFAEVESFGEVQTDGDKSCTKKIKIGAKISISKLCQIAVTAAFEKFGFADKIKKAKESLDNNAGYCGAANAGDYGAANAGECGAAIVRSEGLAIVGENGIAIAFGNGAKAKGKTCPVCREMNGKKFRMSDFQIGITAPPFHPNCDKSSIGPTTPDNEEDEDELDRIRREVREEIKKTNTLSEKERFEEWKKKFVYGDKSEAEVVDKSENGGIINSRSDKVTINAIETPIEQRNTGKGNPNAILHFDIALNNRQIKILEQLPEYDSRVIVDKKSVSMTDLSALTAKTGDEFAMFTKGNERIIVRGNAVSVNIDVELAKKLSADGYKWSGHTHPGTDINVLMPSDGDKKILRCFDQEQSVIYSSKGSYQTFGKE